VVITLTEVTFNRYDDTSGNQHARPVASTARIHPPGNHGTSQGEPEPARDILAPD
jgi:hypothetical protein